MSFVTLSHDALAFHLLPTQSPSIMRRKGCTPREFKERGSSRLETLVWWKVRFVFVFEYYLTQVFGREGGAGELAAPVFLAELCLGLTPALPLLLWVLGGTPWVLLHFLVFLYETLKGNFFKTFPKNL